MKILTYIKVAALALVGVISFLLIRSAGGRDAGLKALKRNFESRKRVYESTNADTRMAEERLARKIEAIDEAILEEKPTSTDGSGAANRLRDLMDWDREGPS